MNHLEIIREQIPNITVEHVNCLSNLFYNLIDYDFGKRGKLTLGLLKKDIADIMRHYQPSTRMILVDRCNAIYQAHANVHIRIIQLPEEHRAVKIAEFTENNQKRFKDIWKLLTTIHIDDEPQVYVTYIPPIPLLQPQLISTNNVSSEMKSEEHVVDSSSTVTNNVSNAMNSDEHNINPPSSNVTVESNKRKRVDGIKTKIFDNKRKRVQCFYDIAESYKNEAELELQLIHEERVQN